MCFRLLFEKLVLDVGFPLSFYLRFHFHGIARTGHLSLEGHVFCNLAPESPLKTYVGWESRADHA